MANKALMITVPILVIGTVFGLGFAGVINIPGVTPAKPKKVVVKAEALVIDKPTAKVTATPKVAAAKPRAVVQTDLEKGQKKLAAIWGEMPVEKFQKIALTFKDPDLAPILRKMDDGYVAQFLASVDPKRAAALSRALQRSAELMPPPAAK